MAKKQPIPENEPHEAVAEIRATPIDDVFAEAARARPAAVRILAEGDSWFAYPKSGLLFGAPSNVVDQLKAIRGEPDMLIHDVSSNGDEAVAMVCGDNKLDLLARLAKREYDLLLFSGGGNDIVGIYDFEFFLNRYQDGFGVAECIRIDRFERRLDQVRNAYCDLIELVGEYSRNRAIRIITHTYDVAEPHPQGAEFFGGLLKISGAKSWMHPYLVTRGITQEELQKGIARYMLERFRDMLKSIAMDPAFAGRFIVVDTHGTIAKSEWLNEIHPTPNGFKKVARRIFDEAIKPLAATPTALPRVAAAKATLARGAGKPPVSARKPGNGPTRTAGSRTARRGPGASRKASAKKAR